MLRRIGDMLVAALAAPLLWTALMALLGLAVDSRTVLNELTVENILAVAVWGTLGFGPSLLLTAFIAIAGLRLAGFRSCPAFLVAGAFMGTIWVAIIGDVQDSKWFATGALAGAICGFLYWRIALRGETRDPKPI